MAILKLRCDEMQVWDKNDLYPQYEIEVSDDFINEFNKVMRVFEDMQEKIGKLYWHQKNNE